MKAADPQQVLRILDVRGVHVRLNGTRLIGRSIMGSMPPDIAHFVTHNKPLIIAELQERERLAETVTNVMALDDVEYGQWAEEIKAAPPGDLNLAHDREAWRQVRRLKQLAQWAAEEEQAA